MYGDFISSIIKNSTIVNNSSVNGGGGLDAGSPGNYAIIVNSIFWNNQPANTDGIVIPYYSNIDIPFGTNNIFTDPLFIDDENDFHLSIGSPCIDSGIDFLVVDKSEGYFIHSSKIIIMSVFICDWTSMDISGVIKILSPLNGDLNTEQTIKRCIKK